MTRRPPIISVHIIKTVQSFLNLMKKDNNSFKQDMCPSQVGICRRTWISYQVVTALFPNSRSLARCSSCYVPSITSPTILVHGTADQIVPFNHSERLFEALQKESRARPLFIEGMGHNNVHSVVRPMFIARLNEFLDTKVWPNAVGGASRKALPYGNEESQKQQDVASSWRR